MTRRLTPEEKELWDHVAAGVKPRRRRVSTPVVPPAPAAQPNAAKPAKRRTVVLKPAAKPEPATALRPAPDPFDLTGLDGKRATRLRKGELEIEGRIDLHGLTLDPAHAALNDFIAAARGSNKRVVLVITGKGEGEGGALKRLVPMWLREAPLASWIAALSPAHARHGGAGAIYVYLRRRRSA
ncbi:Endonuclease MutS2 [Alphaproteobacteria bacterium SO-S41]|nr:Endonuclease MutS2 [Alphaproteobacteria bacterium SO-S41]